MRDPDREAELERFGFTVLPALDAGLLEEVRSAYRRLGPAPDDPQLAINWSFHSQSAEYKHRVKQELLELAAPMLERMLDDHRIYLTTFITKWPGPNSAFAPHQDPSLIDERRFRGVTVWIPLDDTGEIDGNDNGMLHVVPGSHRFSRQLRFSDVDCFPFTAHEQAIIERHGIGVPTSAGEALVFDNRVIHYSGPNQSETPRVVLSFGVRPTEGACILLREGSEGTVDLHEIDDDFYIDVLPAEHHLWQPTDPPVVRLERVRESWTGDEFDAMCERVGPAPRTVRAAAPSASGLWNDPGVFCSVCGGTDGLSATDRHGRNNAQLVCPACVDRIGSE